MPEQATRIILQEIIDALDLAPGFTDRVRFSGDDRLPSCFAVTELAAASIAAAGLALADLVGRSDDAPLVTVDNRLASLWFGFSIHPQGWSIPAAWDALAGDYPTRDGWIKLHTNALHHKAAAMKALGCAESRDAVAEAARQRNGAELEETVVAAGGCAAALRSKDEWLSHPQGRAVAAEPLILWDQPGKAQPTDWSPSPDRPLAGLRVLDLTRVLAGPVATRFLAGYGAQVLRIDPQGWDDPGVTPEVTLGKRCARLDLHEPEGRRVFEQLLAQADIVVHGYRADALERIGLGAEVRQAIRPGLIDISLDAYGHSGPWANRRAFDSLVQFSSGIAAAGMAWRNSDVPVSLPVQALDQATGYLMAAAAIRAVAARMRGEPQMRARMSLARTAHLLCAHEPAPNEAEFPASNGDDLSETVEYTMWGPAKRVKPPLLIDGYPMHWDSPAVPLGSALAEWL